MPPTVSGWFSTIWKWSPTALSGRSTHKYRFLLEFFLSFPEYPVEYLNHAVYFISGYIQRRYKLHSVVIIATLLVQQPLCDTPVPDICRFF